MDIGPLGTYRLPAIIQDTYDVTTAQELADRLGVAQQPTVELGRTADAAYQALRRGDNGPARALLIEQLGVAEETADAALAKLPRM
ncbi:MAG TPA: hypothetical protein VNJ54_05830 [Plantibacter sp.]|uniref:hypothetical protein n=1 Tax=unclassified Plantibacter TaxID=2624265 RepID=UPI002B6D47F4|nr:hypothetical protein [Plantibacter sp.]